MDIQFPWGIFSGKIVRVDLESRTWVGVKKSSGQVLCDKVARSDIALFKNVRKAIAVLAKKTGQKKDEIISAVQTSFGIKLS